MPRPHVTPLNHEIIYAQSDASGNAVPVTYNTVNGGLDVNVVSGGSGGGSTQYVDGQVAPANPTGTEIVYTNSSGNNTTASVANPLPVKGGYVEQAGLSASALNADLVPSTDVSAYKWLTLQTAGTFTSIYSFQASNDNVTWYPVGLINPVGGNQTSQSSNSGVALWTGPVVGRYFRVRATAYTSGTIIGTLELYTSPNTTLSANYGATQSGLWNVSSREPTGSTLPTVSFPIGIRDGGGLLQTVTSGAQIGDAAVGGNAPTNANMLYNGSTFDRQRSSGPIGTAAVAGSFTEQAGLSAAALNADLLSSTDVSGYKSFSLSIAGTWSGTLSAQGSNDNVSFYPIQWWNTSDGTAASSTTATGNSIKIGPVYFRYIRVRMTSYTSGTATGTLEQYTHQFVPSTQGVIAGFNSGSNTIGNVGGTVADQTTDSGNPLKTGAKYNATQPSYTDGMRADSQSDTRGNLKVTLMQQNGTSGIGTQPSNTDSLGVDASNVLLKTFSLGALYNGSSLDRQRNNITGTVIAPGGTASGTLSVTTYNAQRALFALNLSSSTGTGTVQLTFNGVTANGYIYPILVGTAVTGAVSAAVTVYRIGPGLNASANAVANDLIPRTIQVVATVTGTVSFGVDYQLSL